MAGLLSNGKLITSDTEGEGIFDCLLGVFVRWTEDGEETNKLKPVAFRLVIIAIKLLVCHRKGTETMGGKFLNIGFEAVLDIISLIARAEVKDDTGHIPLVTCLSLPEAS